MKPETKLRVLSGLAAVALESWLGTCRFRDIRTETFRSLIAGGQPVIFALWHGRLLPLAYRFRGNGYVPLISRSRDGEGIARVVQRWGYRPVRGSTNRGGGEALRELIRLADSGHSLVFTPDGPRGPFQQLKPGVLTAAQFTGCPIIPAAASARNAWFFGKWDRFLVPRPFTRVDVVFGPPIEVPRDAGAEELEAKRGEVTAALNAVLAEADALARRA